MDRIALRLATSPRIKLSQFKALSRHILRLNEQQQRREAFQLMKQRLELEQKKFEFNSARAALMHLMPLQEISENKSLDDEDKLRAARKQIFGDSAPDK